MTSDRASLDPAPPSTVIVRWALEPDAQAPANDLAIATAALALGLEPVGLSLSRRCPRCQSTDHGAPVLAGASAAVSLARSHDAVIAAAAPPHVSVGVDIESVTSVLEPSFAQIAFSPQERAREPHPSSHTLLRAWVRKEAILKAAGTGLRRAPSTVTLDGLRVLEGPPGPWWLADLDVGDGHIAAVAVRGVVDPVLDAAAAPPAGSSD